MPSSKLESSLSLVTTVPRVGACFFGLLGRALPRCVKAEAEGSSGTVSTTSEEMEPFKLDVLGVEVMTKSGAELSSSTLERKRKVVITFLK